MAKVIISEIRKEFEEIYVRLFLLLWTELFLNRQYFPKLKEAYEKLITDIATRHNVTKDDIYEAADGYFDIPEIAEQRYFIKDYFLRFEPYGNEESYQNILPADFTIQILKEQLDIIKSCLNKADDEICKKDKSISKGDIAQQLKEKIYVKKQYKDIYEGIKRSYETKLFNKYGINKRIVLIATSKYRKDPSFISQYEKIKVMRKNKCIKYGFDV